MKTLPTILVVRLTALVVLLFLTLRLLYLASHLETGLPTLATEWRNSTLSWLIGPYIPISERPTAEQADFWLAETERILCEHPNNARLAMAAALVLDSSGSGFVRSHLQAIRIISGRTFPEMDREAIEMAQEEFESRCHRRCLDLAARATELEPNNVAWWRLRAILLFRSGDAPRDQNWLQLLDDFASHDPDNALYDYLAAGRLWDQSTKWANENDKLELLTLDSASFDDGIRRFDRAQTKPFLAIGDVGYTVITELLDLAHIARTDQPDIINSREIHFRRTLLIMYIWRWRFVVAEQKVLEGDIAAALAMRRQGLRVIDQYAAVGGSTSHESYSRLDLRKLTGEWMHNIASTHSEAITAAEAAEIDTFRISAHLEQQVLQRAAQTLPQNKSHPRRGFTYIGVSTSLAEISVALTPQTATVLSVVGLLGAFLLCWTGPANASLCPMGHLTALIIAAAASITIFGLAPAQIISQPAQAWAATALILITLAGMFGYFGWQSLRRRRYQFSLRAFLVGSVVLSLICVVAIDILDKLPFPLFVYPHTQGEIDPESLGQWFTKQGAQAWWIVGQWIAYRGHLWTIAIWAALVGLLYHWKLQRLARRNLLSISALTLSCRAAGFIASITRPAFIMSALLLLLYLLIEPHHLQQIDRRFQQDISFARDPEAYWQTVSAAVQAVRSNPKLMAEIENDVNSAAN